MVCALLVPLRFMGVLNCLLMVMFECVCVLLLCDVLCVWKYVSVAEFIVPTLKTSYEITVMCESVCACF